MARPLMGADLALLFGTFCVWALIIFLNRRAVAG